MEHLEDVIEAGHQEPAKSGETSSRNHRQAHAYAANHDQFPGWLATGGTAQSAAQPVILAQAEVGKPAIRGADKKTRPSRREARVQ